MEVSGYHGAMGSPPRLSVGAPLWPALAAGVAVLTGAAAVAAPRWLGLPYAASLAFSAVAMGLLAASLYGAAVLRERAGRLAAVCHAARLGSWRQPHGAVSPDISADLRALLGAAPDADDQDRDPQVGGGDPLLPLNPDDRAALRAMARRVATTLRPERMDVRAVSPGGCPHHLLWETRAETDSHGRVVALWGYAQDITDRHAAEERERQASRMDALGQMAAGLAHDFNNLLCTVVLNLDMLAEARPPVTAAGITQLAGRARAAAERGAALAAQLLAFAGELPLHAQMLDLPHAVDGALAGLTVPTGVTIAFAPPDTALTVHADAVQLGAAIQALLTRATQAVARQAPASGGTIRISLRETVLDARRAAALALPPGRYAELAVHDETEAPPPDVLPRMLEPFFRLSADGSDPGRHGVHLALAHGVARGHGGVLTLEGQPGTGTTTRLLLPLQPLGSAGWADTPPASPHHAAAPVALHAGLRVLLVEDDAAVRETTELLLREGGAAVTTAADGAAALALLEGGAVFDLLLSDVVLPGWLSGIDVVEAAAALRPGLPALLASGYAAPARELGRALPDGVTLLHKPYRRADLLDAIAATLSRTQAA